MVTVLDLKSTLVTSSATTSMPASAYHSRGRQRSFSGSAIRALESLVRSMMMLGSREMMVIEPGYLSSRRVWAVPMVPLPLWELV